MLNVEKNTSLLDNVPFELIHPNNGKHKLAPIVKWAGGKEKELKYILPNLPSQLQYYFEPFIGGGAVYAAIQSKGAYINDKSDELINLYRVIASPSNQTFYTAIEKIIKNWKALQHLVVHNNQYFNQLYKAFSSQQISETTLSKTLSIFIEENEKEFEIMFEDFFHYKAEDYQKELHINLFRKIKRMRMIEQKKHQLPDKDILENIETGFKSAFYMTIRHIYNYQTAHQLNKEESAAIFLFIRNFAYSGMFRYNASGKFNVPYGGIGYNRKDFAKKVRYLKSPELRTHLEKTIIENLDFEDFLKKHQPKATDFIFLDPPYDSEFSTYAQNQFTKKDQIRLAKYLINECQAKWMMVIKNTEFIYSLYANKGLNIMVFEKKYLVSFMNRNDKNAKHLMITNY